MKKIVCEMCGGTDLVKQGGVFVCQSCGCKYSVEDAQKLMVEVSGTVKIDKTDEIQSNFKLARRAREIGDIKQAAIYYAKILSEKPDDWEAYFYSTCYAALDCRVFQMQSAANTIKNSVKPTLLLIKKLDSKEQKVAYLNLEKGVNEARSFLRSAATNAYNDSDPVSFSGEYFGDRINELRNRCYAADLIVLEFANQVFEIFSDLDTACRIYQSEIDLKRHTTPECTAILKSVGRYIMTAEEKAEAVKKIESKIVSLHYQIDSIKYNNKNLDSEQKKLKDLCVNLRNTYEEYRKVAGYEYKNKKNIDYTFVNNQKLIQLEEKNKKSVKAKRIGKIVVPIIAAVVVFIVILLLVILPSSEYNNAVSLMNGGNYDEAIAAFESMDGYSDSEDKIIEIRSSKEYLATLSIGDNYYFGKYGDENIEWRILDKIDNEILVISEYGIDCKKYNEQKGNITWENCSLRKWLNDEFYNTAFSEEEKKMISVSNVTTDKNPDYNTPQGNNTQDNVFLLSINEANKYFASNEERQCAPTEYTVSNGVYNDEYDGTCWWWLRSSGIHSNRAAYVFYNGGVNTYGLYVDHAKGAVRPALWINLES